MAGIMSTPEPWPEPCALVLAAADHGVADEGVSAYPKSVTVQMRKARSGRRFDGEFAGAVAFETYRAPHFSPVAPK